MQKIAKNVLRSLRTKQSLSCDLFSQGNDFIFLLQNREEDDEADADGANYQLDMMKCLREVNVDNNTIGW